MRTILQLESGLKSDLLQFGLIRLSGQDAIDFAHRQLSNDIISLRPDSARFAGYLTSHGLLLATALVWKRQSDVMLMVARDVVVEIIKRLMIYVLRSKVQITNESEKFSIVGTGGKKATEAVSTIFGEMPETLYARAENETGEIIRVSNAFGSPRYLLITPNENAKELSLDSLMNTTDEDWELGDIEAGIPQIYATTQDRFLPRALNMEEVNGLNWTKGCFPGRGTIAHSNPQKQQMQRMHALTENFSPAQLADIRPGSNIFNPHFPQSSAGTVIRIARRDEQRIDCLTVIEKENITSTALHLGAVHGPKLFADSLPYEPGHISR